jgi:hypothetical protein
MNGIKRTVIAELQRSIIRDAVCETLLHEVGAELSKAQMNEVNNHLLDVVIISAAHETGSLYKAEFTSYLNYRIRLHTILPLHLP